MYWIILSLIYAIFNAIYIAFNETKHFNGYVLGIWRGFGISIISLPLLITTNLELSPTLILILIIQGLMIGIYDSHVFFASAKYGANTSSGFMATSVIITSLLWWIIEYHDFQQLMQNKTKLLNITFILIGFSISYWQMMKVHITESAEQYLYPAVFSLAIMSIATRYIAINNTSVFTGVSYYLTISCFISGVYNLILFLILPPNMSLDKSNPLPSSKPIKKKDLLIAPIKSHSAIWLIIFSIILITAKTLALRMSENPTYVVSILLLTPIFSEIIKTRQLKITQAKLLVITFLILMLFQT